MKRKTMFLRVFMRGLLVGGIAASVLALFTAPQSGMETRRMFQEKSDQVRDGMVHTYESTRKQVKKIVADTRKRTDRIARRVDRIEKRISRLSHRLVN